MTHITSYKSLLISVLAVCGIFTVGSALSQNIENITIQGVALGENIEALDGTLISKFPNWGSRQHSGRCYELDPNMVEMYKDLKKKDPSAMAMMIAGMTCGGDKDNGKKSLSLSYNGSTKKIFEIIYTQEVHVADNLDGCLQVVEDQMRSLEDTYGGKITPRIDSDPRSKIYRRISTSIGDYKDVGYTVIFNCGVNGSPGNISKFEKLRSDKVYKERPPMPKSKLD